MVTEFKIDVVGSKISWMDVSTESWTLREIKDEMDALTMENIVGFSNEIYALARIACSAPVEAKYILEEIEEEEEMSASDMETFFLSSF